MLLHDYWHDPITNQTTYRYVLDLQFSGTVESNHDEAERIQKIMNETEDFLKSRLARK